MNPDADMEIDTETVRTALRKVVDPENAINIVDLGLIYGIEISKGTVRVQLTMTSPACPMSEVIIDDVDAVLAELLAPRYAAEIQLVWEPPWNPDMMNPRVRAYFGG